MTRKQKRAMHFAYRLLRGDYANQIVPGTTGPWIEPDRTPGHPFYPKMC
jgi:hypothetical protein